MSYTRERSASRRGIRVARAGLTLLRRQSEGGEDAAERVAERVRRQAFQAGNGTMHAVRPLPAG